MSLASGQSRAVPTAGPLFKLFPCPECHPPPDLPAPFTWPMPTDLCELSQLQGHQPQILPSGSDDTPPGTHHPVP